MSRSLGRALWIVLFSGCSLSYQFLISSTLASVTGWTVWSQVAGMSVFLAAMGVGTLRSERVPAERAAAALFDRELALSALGALAAPLILSLYCAIKIFSHNPTLDPFVASEASLRQLAWLALPLPALAGYLAGFELPLLLRLSRASGRVLALNYVGALAASLAFASWLGQRVSPVEAGLLLAWVNALAALGFAWQRQALGAPRIAAALGLLGALAGLAAMAPAFEREYLQIRYSRGVRALRVRGIERFLDATVRRDIRVERVRTGYQTLDFVTRANSPGTEFYLDGKIQVHEAWAAAYHESLVHLPVQFFGRIPRRALVLGAGDGLVAHELLKYGERVEKITVVELDPEMAALGRDLDFFRSLNGDALRDPKVELVIEDALAYLRQPVGALYDAVYIDFPLPYDYDLLKLYSYEIYRLIGARLAPDGFIAMDAATLDPARAVPESAPGFARWRRILASTLDAAGFKQLVAYEGSEGFVAARKAAAAPPAAAFVDHGIALKVVDAAYVRRALAARPLPPPDPASVNSIFRPQLHSLQDFQF